MRINAGYIIIDSRRINAGNELVIGYNVAAPAPYVCWYCRGGNDYYWGVYTGTLEQALQALNDRMNR